MFVTSYHNAEGWKNHQLGPGSIASANTNLRSLHDDWRHTPVNQAYPDGTWMVVHFDSGGAYRGTVNDWGRGNLEPRPSFGLPNGIDARHWIDVWTPRQEVAEWATVDVTH
jgi:hypothetical protein